MCDCFIYLFVFFSITVIIQIVAILTILLFYWIFYHIDTDGFVCCQNIIKNALDGSTSTRVRTTPHPSRDFPRTVLTRSRRARFTFRRTAAMGKTLVFRFLRPVISTRRVHNAVMTSARTYEKSRILIFNALAYARMHVYVIIAACVRARAEYGNNTTYDITVPRRY